MQHKRIVITGMGVVSPNGIGLDNFEEALRKGKSGIRKLAKLEELGFACQVGAEPILTESLLEAYFSPLQRKRLTADGLIYGCISAIDAWTDAGLPYSKTPTDEPDWDSGCIFGQGLAGAEVIREAAYTVDAKKVKRLGSTTVPQTMSSGISAHLGGMLGLGNRVTSNSSACATGTEALIMGLERIRMGRAKRMLCGSCDSSSAHVWAGFDAMRVLTRKHNDSPTTASRPMSETATGFVPGGGGAALVLEELSSALKRNAPIYAEVLGGYSNSGGQRQKGSMTAPNPEGVLRCIHGAIADAEILSKDINLISGHLTSTMFDPREVELWYKALNIQRDNFPKIQALKSMTGHCLSASGSIEAVASVLQIHKNFIHPSINCEDLHPDISQIIPISSIPQKTEEMAIETVASSSFGFGDVNSCLIFKRFQG